MKFSIEVQFYKWSDSYQVHAYIDKTDYLIILYDDNSMNVPEWEIQTLDDKPGDYRQEIPELPALSEEEAFQQSVAWDAPVDYYKVHAIQEHIIGQVSTWTTDLCYNTELEY